MDSCWPIIILPNERHVQIKKLVNDRLRSIFFFSRLFRTSDFGSGCSVRRYMHVLVKNAQSDKNIGDKSVFFSFQIDEVIL